MGLRDWAHEWQWRARNGIGYEQLKAIRKDTMEMLENRDIKGLKGLLDTYAGSYDIPEEIAMGIARKNFILTPEDAADKDILAAMESLKSTWFVQQQGTLASLPVEEADGIHGMLAMHVFMWNVIRDAAYPVRNRKRWMPPAGFSTGGTRERQTGNSVSSFLSGLSRRIMSCIGTDSRRISTGTPN